MRESAPETLKDFSNLLHCLGDFVALNSDPQLNAHPDLQHRSPYCLFCYIMLLGSVNLSSEQQKWSTKNGKI